MIRSLVFLSLAALAGCGPGGDDASDAPARARTVGSAEIELLPAEAGFAHIRSVVLAGEALWVLDGAPPYLTRVSLEDGKTLQFGGEGQGPAELLSPWDIQPAPELDPPGIQVWDPGNNRVSTFDGHGSLITNDRLGDEGLVRARSDIRNVSYADPFRIRNAGNGVLIGSFPTRIDRTSDLGSGTLRLADRQLNPGSEVLHFSDHVAQGAESLKEWVALPFWDVCSEVVALWSPESSSVNWIGMDGEVQGTVAVTLEPQPLTVDDVAAYLRWMARLELGPDFENAPIDFEAMALDSQDRFATTRPGATDLRCESEDAAWLRMFDTTTDPLGRGHSWFRVSRDGRQQEVTFPLEFTPTVFTSQGAFGFLETPEGEQRLARWSNDLTAGT
jgi:hypothetical protein